MNNLTLITSNPEKAKEFQQILGGLIKDRRLEIPEIQSYSLEEVVLAKARAAYDLIGQPILVDDVATDFAMIKGFPGPFIKFWDKEVGYDHTVVMARLLNATRVRVRCGIGYYDGQRSLYAEGTCEGELTERRGENGWGFDPYIIPDGYTQTLAELGPAIKNQISHRARGLEIMRQKLIANGVL